MSLLLFLDVLRTPCVPTETLSVKQNSRAHEQDILHDMYNYHGDLVNTYRMYGLVYDADGTWGHVAYQADQTYLSLEGY